MCQECAKEHKKLHSGISYVMSIADAGERYSQHKVELFKFGGNQRFKDFTNSYIGDDGACIFAGCSIGDIYRSNACKYYRHKIEMLAR